MLVGHGIGPKLQFSKPLTKSNVLGIAQELPWKKEEAIRQERLVNLGEGVIGQFGQFHPGDGGTEDLIWHRCDLNVAHRVPHGILSGSGELITGLKGGQQYRMDPILMNDCRWRADGPSLVFALRMTVKQGKTNFGGPFAQYSLNDRFFYLSISI